MARTPATDQYKYVLEWIKESTDARRSQNALVERTIRAYQGEPSVNYYKRSMRTYADLLRTTDAEKGKQMLDYVNEIPEKKSMVLHDAVEAVVSMTMGGVGRFEFGPYDPDMAKDDDTIDLLASAAKHFYNQEKVDSLVPQFIRSAVLSGDCMLHLKQKNKRMCLTMLDSSQCLLDPKRNKTNSERFKGFSQRESWKAVRSRTTKTQGGYILKSLNEVDTYVSQIIQELNNVNGANAQQSFLHEELRKDLDLFYKPILTSITDTRSKSVADGGNPDYLYDGDEIEMTYMYDKQNDMYFEIVNRKYITTAKTNPLTRTVMGEFLDAFGKSHKLSKQIKLDDPFIELPYLKTFWDRYPISPLFYVLDDFDSLCSMESVLYHNLSVMAPITFVGQSSDGQKVARISSIAGEIVDGMPQTFGVLGKTHDITPTVTAIQRYEERIKKIIGATDQFQMQGMIGDRATAKEVVAAQGQVSQALNPFIANVETTMGTLGDKFLKLYLIMNNETYSFVHNGKYAELAPEDIAGDYEVQAKLTSSIKLEQEAQARKGLELIQYLGQSEALDKKAFLGTLIPIVMNSLVNRQQAEAMVMPQYRVMPPSPVTDEVADPITQEELDKMTPEEMDALIKQVSDVHADPNAYFDLGLSTDPSQAATVAAGQQPPTDPTQQAIDPSQFVAPSTDPAQAGLPQTNSSVEAAGAAAGDPTGEGYVS